MKPKKRSPKSGTTVLERTSYLASKKAAAERPKEKNRQGGSSKIKKLGQNLDRTRPNGSGRKGRGQK